MNLVIPLADQLAVAFLQTRVFAVTQNRYDRAASTIIGSVVAILNETGREIVAPPDIAESIVINRVLVFGAFIKGFN
jgi:hypothetical protein